MGKFLFKVIIINYIKNVIFSGWSKGVRVMIILNHTKFLNSFLYLMEIKS